MASLPHQSPIISLSWIPPEAAEGRIRIPFDAGMACRVASVKAEQLERGALHELSKGHPREGKRPKKPVRD